MVVHGRAWPASSFQRSSLADAPCQLGFRGSVLLNVEILGLSLLRQKNRERNQLLLPHSAMSAQHSSGMKGPGGGQGQRICSAI